MNPHTRHVVTASVVLGILAVGAGAFIWSGMYNIGADEPHWMPTMMAVNTLRERSIASRMANVKVPDLNDPKLIAAGVEDYSGMCTGCHLAPGVSDTEIRPGLYPMPPDLTTIGSKDPKRTFWIIKHGIKMSAMPAWGKTHTDEQIWSMVAFIQKLPGMTPAQYAALGGKPPAQDEDHMHMDGDSGSTSMPGMKMDESQPHAHMHADGAAAQDKQSQSTASAAGQIQHRHADGTIESHPAPITQPETGHEHHHP